MDGNQIPLVEIFPTQSRQIVLRQERVTTIAGGRSRIGNVCGATIGHCKRWNGARLYRKEREIVQDLLFENLVKRIALVNSIVP